MTRWLLALAAIPLAGCVAASASEPVDGRLSAECRAGPGQAFIGKMANAETGAEMLEATGATEIRWVPPRTMVTQDYRPYRLTVYYDDDMAITRVSCT